MQDNYNFSTISIFSFINTEYQTAGEQNLIHEFVFVFRICCFICIPHSTPIRFISISRVIYSDRFKKVKHFMSIGKLIKKTRSFLLVGTWLYVKKAFFVFVKYSSTFHFETKDRLSLFHAQYMETKVKSPERTF